MTADDYKKALAFWKIRHKAAAKFFGITVITSQRYSSGHRKVPASMETLIRLMLAMKLDPCKVQEWIGEA